MTEQDQCEFMKWAVANYDIKGDPYENAKAAYLSARRTQSEQVRELVEALQACVQEWGKRDCFLLPEEKQALEQARNALAAQLKEQDQPAGEWITINADGSNLPEHVAGAEWYVFIDSDTLPSEERWVDWHPEDWDSISVWAYWSIPHIDRRTTYYGYDFAPVIPNYAPQH